MHIGILGAGQLGQMLALAGYPLGHRFTFLDTSGSPSADIGTTLNLDSSLNLDADSTTRPDSAAAQSAAHLAQFLQQVDVVTYEFEHLPVDLVEKIEQHKPVYPSSRALKICQNRGLEKALFTQLSIPTPEYQLVNSAAELHAAVATLGPQQPLVAKTLTEGYDGKGQAVIKPKASTTELDAIWNQLGQRQLIVEKFIDFEREVSIIAVRDTQGKVSFYPLAENHHDAGILRYSLAPLPNLSPAIQQQAESLIQALLQELDYVGVLTLELFQQANGQLLANEMAPRVHNSGHWTQNGAITSQFENHLRAITGLPLGATTALAPTCMLNIIGHKPDPQQLLQHPHLHLHLYGKTERPGRKLGHINLVAATTNDLLEQVSQLAPLLPQAPAPKFSCLANKPAAPLD